MFTQLQVSPGRNGAYVGQRWTGRSACRAVQAVVGALRRIGIPVRAGFQRVENASGRRHQRRNRKPDERLHGRDRTLQGKDEQPAQRKRRTAEDAAGVRGRERAAQGGEVQELSRPQQIRIAGEAGGGKVAGNPLAAGRVQEQKCAPGQHFSVRENTPGEKPADRGTEATAQ